MSISSGSQHSVFYIPEVTYGTTPATPTWTPFPHNSYAVGMTKDSIVSNKLRDDRQIEDFRHGNKQMAGDIGFDLEFGSFDDILEAVMCGTWATDVLKAGTTRRSFTIERKFSDIATPEWHRTVGSEFDSLSVSVAPNQMVSCTASVMGKDLAIATSEVTSSTYSADPTNQPFDSFTGSIQEGGSTIAIVTALDLNLQNSLATTHSIGSDLTNRPSIGQSNLTGSLTSYFESKALYEKFINETSSSIVLVLTDPAGNDLEFDIPNLKYSSGNPDVSDAGTVTISLDFQALYSVSDASQLVITRTAA